MSPGTIVGLLLFAAVLQVGVYLTVWRIQVWWNARAAARGKA